MRIRPPALPYGLALPAGRALAEPAGHAGPERRDLLLRGSHCRVPHRLTGTGHQQGTARPCLAVWPGHAGGEARPQPASRHQTWAGVKATRKVQGRSPAQIIGGSRLGAKGHGQAPGMWPVHRVGHLQVAVRLGAVAGAPALAELVTGGDRLTGSDAHRPAAAGEPSGRTGRRGQARSPHDCRQRLPHLSGPAGLDRARSATLTPGSAPDRSPGLATFRHLRANAGGSPDPLVIPSSRASRTRTTRAPHSLQ